MDERRLRYFLAVLDEGSVTRAAAALRVAQPSLSQALRAFEAELGVELFHRVGRGLKPTAAAQAFSGPAREVLRATEDARHAIDGVVTLRAGRLDLAALATLAVDPMAGLIGRFRARHPGVQVRLLVAETSEAMAALVLAGEAELGAASLPAPAGGLAAEPLPAQELQFILPPLPAGADHADVAPGASLRPEELAAIPLVVTPPGTSTRVLLEQALAAVGVVPLIAVETAAREAIVPLVLAGAGAALLPAPLAREAQRRGARLRRAEPPVMREIGLVHRDTRPSAAARALLDLLDDPEPDAVSDPGAVLDRSGQSSPSSGIVS